MKLIDKREMESRTGFWALLELYEDGADIGGWNEIEAKLEIDAAKRLVGVWVNFTRNATATKPKSDKWANLLESKSVINREIASEFQRRFDEGAFDYDMEWLECVHDEFTELRHQAARAEAEFLSAHRPTVL